MAYVSLNFLFRQRLFLLITLLFFQFDSTAQNLVPNPSFEELDSCITGLNQLQKAIGWKTILFTPDCLNRCGSGLAYSVPGNVGGFQEPQYVTENGYAGIVNNFFRKIDYTEIIGIVLAQPLIVGQKYYFKMFYSAGYRSQTGATCFSNNLGIKLFTTNFNCSISYQAIIDNNSILHEDSVLTDTLNWNEFKGNFIADSAYSFLAIGNFYSPYNTTTVCFDTLNVALSYVFLDNICLSNTEDNCSEGSNLPCKYEFSVTPNPSSGFISINKICENAKGGDLFIYNSIGQLVIQKFIEADTLNLNLSSLAKGVYFLKINSTVIKIILT